MSTSLSELLAFRAEKLAFLHLTRRDDLIVTEAAGRESGLDFLVTLARGGVPSVRVFGVQAKAREGSVSDAGTLDTLMETRTASEAPFPLCLFLFTMSDDRGYYRWVKKPVVASAEKAALGADGPTEWRPLDDEALQCIVDSVDAWYEARQRPRAA
jgi:hypothetical protein